MVEVHVRKTGLNYRVSVNTPFLGLRLGINYSTQYPFSIVLDRKEGVALCVEVCGTQRHLLNVTVIKLDPRARSRVQTEDVSTPSAQFRDGLTFLSVPSSFCLDTLSAGDLGTC